MEIKALCTERYEQQLPPSEVFSRNQTKSKVSFKTGLAVTHVAGPPDFSKTQHLPERF